MYVVKVAFWGSLGAGRSVLLHRYMTGEFLDQNPATIGINFTLKKVQLYGKEFRFHF